MNTNRENEIINLIVKGYTTKRIAAELNISYHTVKTHIEHIFIKHNIHNRMQLIIKLLKDNQINI